MKIYKIAQVTTKEELIDSIRELTQRIEKLVEENFGYSPSDNHFDLILNDRYNKLELLKDIDFGLYTEMMDEI